MDFQKNITVEAPTLENLNLQTFDMKSIEEFVVSHKIQLDFAWHLFIYAPLILRPQFTRHFTSSKMSKYQKLPWIPLVIHMLLGLTIIFRYQYRAITSGIPPAPENFDVLLGITNALVSWRLCKYEARGNPRLVRVGFQVMALMVFFPAVMCYQTADPVWYHALVKMHNAFIYVRWLIIGGTVISLFSSFHELYTISVFFGGILGVWEGKFPWDGVLGVPLALVLHVALVVVERYMSSFITPKNSRSNPLIQLLLLVGLVEVETYKTLKEPVAKAAPEEKNTEATKT